MDASQLSNNVGEFGVLGGIILALARFAWKDFLEFREKRRSASSDEPDDSANIRRIAQVVDRLDETHHGPQARTADGELKWHYRNPHEMERTIERLEQAISNQTDILARQTAILEKLSADNSETKHTIYAIQESLRRKVAL